MLCTVVGAYICVVDVNHNVCRLLLVESRSGCVLSRSVCQRLFLAHRHCCEGSLSLITRRSPRAALCVDRRQFTAAAIRGTGITSRRLLMADSKRALLIIAALSLI